MLRACNNFYRYTIYTKERKTFQFIRYGKKKTFSPKHKQLINAKAYTIYPIHSYMLTYIVYIPMHVFFLISFQFVKNALLVRIMLKESICALFRKKEINEKKIKLITK